MAQVEIQAGPHRFVAVQPRGRRRAGPVEPGVLAVAAVKATNVSVGVPAEDAVTHAVAPCRDHRLLAGLVAVGLVGCGSDGTDAGSRRERHGIGILLAVGLRRHTVLAAASLTESFTTLGSQFEAAHAGVTVTFGFFAGGQLGAGHPDHVRGAGERRFGVRQRQEHGRVVAAGAAADPRVFAKNAMEIAVPPTNPGQVTGLDSLAEPTSRPRSAGTRCCAAPRPRRCSPTPVSPSPPSPWSPT